jgi:hypothetical protein
MTTQFRSLPVFGGDPRATAEIVNGIMNGKTNNTGTITLATGDATTTTIYDKRISVDSKIIVIPWSAAAFTDSTPYGAFQDSTDQSAASTTAAYAVTFNTTDFSHGVTVASNSRITAKSYGIYNAQFSLQFANADTQIQDVDVWFSKNGTNIANSNSRFSIPNSHGGVDGHLIASLNFWVELSANDYFELMWRTSSTQVTIQQIPAQTSPTRPATPSAILTVNYASSNGTNAAGDYSVYVSAQTQGEATLTHFANSTSNKTYAYVIVG